MQAIVLESYGGPEVLTMREVDDPTPGAEEALVAIAATACNRADLLQRRGLYPGPPMAHEIPGMELAGTVVAVGERVREVAVGDEVMAIVGGGAYAQRIAVHARQLMAVPPSVALVDAAAIPEVWITAWDALVLQGGLTSGGWALVHAGASGVGTAAISLCRALGARVVVTTSAGKVAACSALGADAVVDYGAQDFVEVVSEVTAGAGVDVVLDVVGGDYLARNVRSLRVGGRIVQVGVMGGGVAELNLGVLLPKRASIIGTVLRARPLEEKISLSVRFARQILPLFADGRCAPVIDSRFALAEVAAAHERMERNENVGKILIDVPAG